jgi:hypothetical protein
MNHRPSDAACQTTPPPGQCNFSSSSGGGPPGECSSDAQCSDAGKDGRCVEQGGGAVYCACTYDACSHDTDCPTGKTCACHGSPYDGPLGNACVPGDCRVDADCGAGGYCSPTMSNQGCGGLGGYYCHTPQDQCIDDSDCPSSNGLGVCTYDTTAKYWRCTVQLLCG